jgi:hypothetical protein
LALRCSAPIVAVGPCIRQRFDARRRDLFSADASPPDASSLGALATHIFLAPLRNQRVRAVKLREHFIPRHGLVARGRVRHARERLYSRGRRKRSSDYQHGDHSQVFRDGRRPTGCPAQPPLLLRTFPVWVRLRVCFKNRETSEASHRYQPKTDGMDVEVTLARSNRTVERTTLCQLFL